MFSSQNEVSPKNCLQGDGFRRWLILFAVWGGLLAAGGCQSGKEPAPKGLSHRVEGALAVTQPRTANSRQAHLAEELERYLEEMSGIEVELFHKTAVDELVRVPAQYRTVIQLSEDGAAGQSEEGYMIRSLEMADGRKVYRIAGSSARGLAYGTYAFLERLGVRFFHPRDELVEVREGLYLPETIDVQKDPWMQTRGWHVHTLHPLEYTRLLIEPSFSHVALAEELIDWLLKTRQNRIAFYLLQNIDFDRWLPYMETVVEYAHRWGIEVVAEVILWQGASLQNAFCLVSDRDAWESQIDERVDFILQLPFDGLLFSFGEFMASDPNTALTWMNHVVERVERDYPGVEVGAAIHVGDYEDTHITYRGEDLFYYFLPQFADPRLSLYVHTVMFYNLYDPAHGVYGHTDFNAHRHFLFNQIAAGRQVHYFPESAYWCSFDIDVPLFLPLYAQSRLHELARLKADLAERNLALDGLLLFSSGHEWGYWLTDYIYARAMYDGQFDLALHLEHVGAGLGPGAESVGKILMAIVELQQKYLLDENLIPYLSGEDYYDELGWAMGIDTHPVRVLFSELPQMSDRLREEFAATVIAPLDTLAERLAASGAALQAVESAVSTRSYPWVRELSLGTRVLALRTAHAVALYRAVLSALDASSADQTERADAFLSAAHTVEQQAQDLVYEMETLYRYELPIYIEGYENHTIYPWGYLAQTHDLCFWRRQRLQAAGMVAHGHEPGDLPTCLD
jgi:hypothetical protein